MRTGFFTAQKSDSPIHRLSGFTKLICFLILTGAVMYSYDLRVILCVMVFSFIILKISKIRFSQIKLMVIYVVVFLAINAILTFLFSPGYGTEIYGTRHVLLKLFGRYDITAETLFFIATKFMKYSSVIPLGMIFLLTTDPSELASSLNAVGVHYKIAFSFSLTLRYFPDIQRDYKDISQAQQARGLEMSGKARMWDRFKRALAILLPLILSTLDRIETITNAMDLRGFGKHKKRTWYSRKRMTRADFIALAVSLVILAATLLVAFFINNGRFYNPFI